MHVYLIMIDNGEMHYIRGCYKTEEKALRVLSRINKGYELMADGTWINLNKPNKPTIQVTRLFAR